MYDNHVRVTKNLYEQEMASERHYSGLTRETTHSLDCHKGCVFSPFQKVLEKSKEFIEINGKRLNITPDILTTR